MKTVHDYNTFSNDYNAIQVFQDLITVYPGMFRLEDDKLFCVNPEYCKGELEILELEFHNLYLHCDKNEERVTIILDMTKQQGRLIQHTMCLSDSACLDLFQRNITACYSQPNNPEFIYYDMPVIQRRFTIKNITDEQ